MKQALRHAAVPWRRTHQAGFTFIEILATLALLAIVLPTIMSGLSLSLNTASAARQKSQACLLLQGKLNQLLAEDQWSQTEVEGDFGENWPEYRWTAQLSDWDGALRQLDLSVHWKQRGQETSVSLTTVVKSGATE